MYSLYKLKTAVEYFAAASEKYKFTHYTRSFDEFKLHERHKNCKLNILTVWYGTIPLTSTDFYYYGTEENSTLAAVFDKGILYVKHCNLEQFVQFFKSNHILDIIHRIELVRTDLIDIAKDCIKHIKKEG